jgi:hypothetical protein
MAFKHPKIEPVLRWTHESLSNPVARGVVAVGSAADSGLLLRPGSAHVEGPFHFTHRMSVLCEDICQRVPAFHHIDPKQVLVTFIRCRNERTWGLQARLVPLRFRGGKLTEIRGRYRYKVQQVFVDRTEIKYVLSFYLPRFLNQSFDEKLITVVHELFHICPEFSGDIRRLPGEDPVHGGSQRHYDRQMAELAREYLRTKPARHVYDFLRFPFHQIEHGFGEIVGLQIPTPKLIPIERID